MTSRTTNRIAAGPREWAGLALLALPTALLAMDVTVLYLATPHLAEALRPSSTQLLWITDVYGFMIAGFLVTMGALGDRIGRRRLLLVGAASFALASALAAYAPNAETLIAARAFLGITGATLMPSTLALISNMFRDAGQRGLAIGIWAACMSGGVALGPVVGGALLEWFWWGSVFLIALPVMAVLLAAGPFLLPEYRDREAGTLDLASVALSLAGVLLVVYGIKLLAEGGRAAVSVAAILAGLSLGALFVRRQRTLAHPLLDPGLFADRVFRGSLLILLLALASVAGVYLFASLYLQQVLGLSPLRAGLWLVPSSLAMTVTALLSSRLTRLMPASWVLAGALAVSAGGYLSLSLLDHTAGPAPLVTGVVVVYLGQGPIMALGTELIVGAAPPERAGAASAISETGTELGLALGVAVLGSVGAAVYRLRMTDDLPASVPPDAARAAATSIAGAQTAAAPLAPGVGAELLGLARTAFTSGLNTIAALAAAVSLALAVLALALRRGGGDSGPGHRTGGTGG